MKRSGRAGALNFNGVKPEENDFLITRLDPFHDAPYMPTGGPGTAPTVVRTFRRAVTVTSPNSAAVGNWSFAVGTGVNGVPYFGEGPLPFMKLRNFVSGVTQTTGDIEISYEYGANNSYLTYQTLTTTAGRGTHHPHCPVYVIGVDSPTIQFSTTVSTATGNAVGPPESRGRPIGIAQFGENVYEDGPSKLVSIAYEVHMTTSDLYNTGVVTVGRVPQALSNNTVRLGAIGTDPAQNAAVVTSAVLPTNTADLLLYSGSRQWPAKYGVYAVAPEASSAVPDFDPNPFAFHLRRSLSWQASQLLPAGSNCLAVTTANRSGQTTIASTEHFDSVFAFFEGLDPRASFQVTVILTYETIPTDNPLLRPLARMPMEIRPHVIETLAHMSTHVDPFCMVSENASGAFFRKVSRAFEVAKKSLNSPAGKAIMRTVAPVVQSSLPPSALTAFRVAEDVAQKYRQQQAKEKKKRRKAQKATAAQKGAVVNPTATSRR